MSLLTDFFIAPRDGMDWEILRAQGPQKVLPTSAWKNVDTVKLGTLENLLTGLPYDEAIARIEKSRLWNENEREGAWVYPVSDPLVSALAALSRESLLPATRAWMATEEWQADGACDDDLSDFLESMKDLSSLARRALSEGKAMFLWIQM